MKKYVIYKNPKDGYESFVERYCLRKRNENVSISKSKLLEQSNRMWKSEELGKNPEALNKYLELRIGEKPFCRYVQNFIFIEIFLLSILCFQKTCTQRNPF